MNKNPLLSCIESRVENSRSFYGRFQLGPFQEGDGVTVANSLRRALLSEITGVAITAVKIRGVPHEYSNLSGVRETVLNILLNLKELVLTSNFKLQEPQVGYLHVQGPGVVKAKDLRLPSCVQCVDPEQHIATVLCNGVVQMKVLISKGKRYTSQAPSGRETSARGLQGKVEVRALYIPRKQWFPTHLRSFAVPSRASTLGLDPGKENSTAGAGLGVESKTENREVGLNKIQANLFPTAAYLNKIQANLFPAAAYQTTPAIFPHAARKFSPPVPLDLFSTSQPFETVAPLSKKTHVIPANPINGRPRPINRNGKGFSNVLPVDAVFMPVNRVNFLIESDQGFSCSSGGKQPLDLIILEVWTDGSIHPRQAIYKAANTLIELLSPLQSSKPLKTLIIPAKTACYPLAALRRKLLSSDKATFLVERKVKVKGRRETKYVIWDKEPVTVPGLIDRELPVSNAYRKTLALDIGNLDLHILSYTVLKRNKIETVNDLLMYSSQDLLDLKGFNEKHLVELRKSLQLLGLRG